MIAMIEARTRKKPNRPLEERNVSLALDETRALLDQLPSAAMLVDEKAGVIMMVNSKATGITAYTRDELNGIPLNDLFPETDFRQWFDHSTDEDDHRTELVRHGGVKIPVLVTLNQLATQKRWILSLELAAEREYRAEVEQRARKRWKALTGLLNIEIPGNLDAALSHMLKTGAEITGAPALAIYQPDEEQIQFTRLISLGEADHLPESIALSDFPILQFPNLWLAGKRPNTGFHRACRVAGIAYSASAPLGRPGAITGLLITAGTASSPPEEILPAVQLLAANISLVSQAHSLSGNLIQQLEEQAKTMATSLALRDAVQDGILLFTPEMALLDMNPSAEQMLGYASHEVSGQPYENILIGAERLLPEIAAARFSRYPHSLGDITLFRRDGRPIHTRVRALALQHQDVLEYWVILLEDLSREEQFRLRSQQLEQRALLGEVTAVFAHEVRNPINNISTGLQLMALNLPEEDPNRALLGRLQQDCDRLAELMKSVLSFARPMELHLVPLDIGSLLDRLLERWHPRLAGARVEYNLHLEPGVPNVMGDGRALEQVFTNLFSNSLQAMQDNGGVLTVKVRQGQNGDEPGHIEISVSDTGIGIPEEVRDRIFEPFFTTHHSGTGLGLAITRRIITAHRGNILVTSIPGGTVFQVYLPAAKSDSPSNDRLV